MGYVKHEAIIVTGCVEEALKKAKSKAESLGLRCTEVLSHNISHGFSFLVVPDGSKEGWNTSNECAEARDAFEFWLKRRERRNPSGTGFVRVEYGGGLHPAILGHLNES